MTDDSHQTHVERVILEAMERGEFDELPGAGKPIAGAGKPDGQWWWFRSWVKRNRVDPGSPPRGGQASSSS